MTAIISGLITPYLTKAYRKLAISSPLVDALSKAELR